MLLHLCNLPFENKKRCDGHERCKELIYINGSQADVFPLADMIKPGGISFIQKDFIQIFDYVYIPLTYNHRCTKF